MAKKDPLFLVVVDESEEMHHALRFACGRAKAIGGKVGLMYSIAPAEFEYWAGVGELMRAEAREEAAAAAVGHNGQRDAHRVVVLERGVKRRVT